METTNPEFTESYVNFQNLVFNIIKGLKKQNKNKNSLTLKQIYNNLEFSISKYSITC